MTWQPSEPRAARAAEEPLVLLRRASTTACPSTTGARIEQVLAERPRPGPDRAPLRVLPGRRRCPRECWRGDQRPVLHDRCRGPVWIGRTPKGVLYAHGGVAGGHSLYVKDKTLRYAFNWIGTHLQDLVADRAADPGPTCAGAEFAMTGPSQDPAMPGSRGPSASTWTRSRSARARSPPSPGTSAWSATASARAATVPHRSPPTTPHRSVHRGDHRQGGRRCVRRPICGPRGPGSSMVVD